MTFTIILSDGRTAAVEGDDITTRTDGSVWILKAVAPKPAALVATAIFARGVWSACYVEGAQVLWAAAESRTAPPEPSRPTPRAL
jgi:hypothetical protein